MPWGDPVLSRLNYRSGEEVCVGGWWLVVGGWWLWLWLVVGGCILYCIG